MFNRVLQYVFAVAHRMLHHEQAQIIEFPTGRRAS